MREIEFRGYSLYQKKFVFGDLVHETKETCIRANQTIEVQGSGDAKNSIITYVVKPETIGQYTGLKDKNGTKIFDGDILQQKEFKMIVEYSNKYASFCIKNKKWAFLHYFGEAVDSEKCEIIGNIHDNPELLK